MRVPLPRAAEYLVATHNPGKLEEIETLLSRLGCRTVSAERLGLTAPVEDADTFGGNAAIKARHACDATGIPTLADDSGLCIPTLGGHPGLETARWARENGGWSAAQAQVYRMLVDKNAWQDGARATMHCALAIAYPGGGTYVFSGEVDGQLVWPPRGDGSGFDAMFVPDGFEHSFAEMKPEEKALIDARAHAFVKFARAWSAQEAAATHPS